MKMRLLHRLLLISTSLTFLLLSISLIYIAKTPVMSYELSVYSSTPVIFWISVILGLINGFLLIYLRIIDKIKGLYIIGIFEILFVNSLVLILYALRNYIMCLLRGDVGDYIGLIKDVSALGSVTNDIYPFTSILVSQIEQISNIPVSITVKYIPVIFYIFSVLSIYCLSKSLIPDKNYKIFSVIASTPLFFAWFYTGIYYMLVSVLTLPFFFYLIYNLKDLRFKVMIIIYCYVYPFFHPFTAIVVLFYLVILYIIQKYSSNYIKKFGISHTLLFLLSVAIAFWFINAYAILRSLYKIIVNLLGMYDATSALAQATYVADKLGLYTTISTLLHLLFDEIIFYSLAVVAIYFIVFKSNALERKRFEPIIACFLSGSLLLLFLFIFTFTHRPDRLLNLNFNMMFAPFLVAYILYLNQKNRWKTIFLISLILLATVSTYFSLYQSPITSRGNDYMTLSEYQGADWLIVNKNPITKTVDLANPISNYVAFIYGVNFRRNKTALQRSYLLPDHFGFTSQFNGSFPMDQDRYLVLSPYDEVCYTNVWKSSLRFEIEDFRKVDKCRNTFKLYENGGFRTYLIRV